MGMFDVVGAGLDFLRGIDRDREARSQQQHSEDIAASNRAEDYARQKEFAQMGIQWRTEDARKAGLHPVFALTGGGAAYSPSSVSVGQPSFDSAPHGQNLGRAIDATLTPEDKLTKELSNRLLAQQIKESMSREALNNAQASNRLGHAQVGPGIPSIGKGDGLILGGDMSETKPAERVSSDISDLSQTAADPSPGWERFVLRGADGRDEIIWLPSSGKGTPTEALESLSESWPMMWAAVKENLRRDPELAYKMRHLWPGGEWYYGARGAIANWLEDLQLQNKVWLSRWAWTRGREENNPGWNTSGRSRGINWRSLRVR